MEVFILAAGEQKRWGKDWRIKQLLPIGGEFLIMRIVLQVLDFGHSPVVITHRQEIAQAVYKHCDVVDNSHAPQANPSICDTALDAYALGPLTTDMTILCGDVVFDPDDISRIFADGAGVRVHGKAYEVFSVTAHGEVGFSLLERSLIKARDWGRVHGVSAKLWHAYRIMAGFGINEHKIDSEIFARARGYTQDIDRPVEYKRFLEVHRWANA